MEINTELSSAKVPVVVKKEIGDTASFMVYGKNSWIRRFSGDERNGEVENSLIHALSCTHPDWIENQPSKETLRRYLRGVSYLPPIGGKIPLALSEVQIEIFPGTKSYWSHTGVKLDEKAIQLAKTFGLEIDKSEEGKFVKHLGMPPKVVTETRARQLPVVKPYLTAEEHIAEIIKRRQGKELGNVFVHQLSVQGRLPDEFKYMAFALILDNPYKSNWSEPIFSAPWGQIAPMIHDGGNTDTRLNPLWRVNGRTDFLQRTSLVKVSNLEELESLTIREIGKLTAKTLEDANAEKSERARLILETKAYQRLALALHCKLGTAPEGIPTGLRKQMGQLWNEYQSSMDILAAKYDIKGALETIWFTKQPGAESSLTGYGSRYEAPWEPIRDELVKVEGTRSRHPELRTRVEGILRSFTQKIDQAIGLIN